MSDQSSPTQQECGSEMAMFGPHVVALCDFLGQSSQLAKWDFVPGTVGEADQWVRAVRESMGRVLTWRKQFETLFKRYQDSLNTFGEMFSAGQSPEKRRLFDEYRQTALHHAHFSDTVIFYSPLQNQHNYWQVSNIAGMLVTCGSLLLAALATKTVFRGAIEVGMLSRFPSGDPYGPGLAKAYYLESKVAQYPRIVVGPTLVSYLETVQKEPDDAPAAHANRQIASLCMSLLGKDEDGCWFVDYLGDAFAALGDKPDSRKKLHCAAFEFVGNEKERFERDGNEKLAGRYSRLLAYFVSRGCTS